jgi:hypothetical protein
MFSLETDDKALLNECWVTQDFPLIWMKPSHSHFDGTNVALWALCIITNDGIKKKTLPKYSTGVLCGRTNAFVKHYSGDATSSLGYNFIRTVDVFRRCSVNHVAWLKRRAILLTGRYAQKLDYYSKGFQNSLSVRRLQKFCVIVCRGYIIDICDTSMWAHTKPLPQLPCPTASMPHTMPYTH